uniref:Uncharacterized protein n=1 Tax=Anguilla anguilla TaxID=7936 RepID=A0A0E9U891_ANGAN
MLIADNLPELHDIKMKSRHILNI